MRPMIRTRVEPGAGIAARRRPARLDRLRLPAWRVPSSRSSSARSRSDSRPGSRARCSSTTTRRSRTTAAQPVDARTVGVLGALFYATELVAVAAVRRPVRPGRPPPDHAARPGLRRGRGDHHRVHRQPPGHRLHPAPRGRVDGRLRALDPRLHRVRDRRRRAAARQGGRAVRGRDPRRADGRVRRSRGPLFQLFGPTAFLLNALVYGVSFAIYKLGVPRDAEPEPAGRAHDPEEGLRRYVRILRGSHVWLLAPTWIAINATLGLYTSQTLFQLVREPDPAFADQQLMGGFDPLQVSVGLAIGGLLFFAGLFYWGGKFRTLRRTSIILYGIVGGAVMLVAAAGDQPRRGLAAAGDPGPRRRRGRRAVRARGRDARRDRPAGGHDRGVPRRPGRDHGPVLGVPGPRPDLRQPRRRRGRPARGPRRDLRRLVHPAGHRAAADQPAAAVRAPGRRRARSGSTGGRLPGPPMPEPGGSPALVPGAGRPRRPGRRRRAPPPRDGGRARVLAAGGHAVDAAIATNAVLGVVMPNGCGIGGDAFWLVWDEAASEQVALNGSGRAAAGARPTALRTQGLDRIPLRGPLGDHRARARSARGATPTRGGVGCPGTPCWAPAIEQADGGFPAWDGLISAIERTLPSLGNEPWAAGFRRVWQPLGRSPRPGERVRLDALARTLRTLASDGFDAYYDGDLGERIARGLAAAGSPITHSDLRDQHSEWTTPIETTYRDVRVTTHPPNSSGHRRARDPQRPRAVRAAGRRPLRRPRLVRRRLDPPAARGRQARARRPRRAPRRPGVPRRPGGAAAVGGPRGRARGAASTRSTSDPAPPPVRRSSAARSTSRSSTRDGNAVSLIQSNAAGFGSGVLDPDTGVHFQNRGASFSLDPAQPQRPRARQAARPHAAARDAVPAGRAPAVDRRRVDGRRQPAPDPRAARVGARRRRRRPRDGHRRAARRRRSPRAALAPPVAVVDGRRPGTGRRRGPRAPRSRPRRGWPTTASSGHEHAIELVDGGPAGDGTLAAATDPRSYGLPAVR